MKLVETMLQCVRFLYQRTAARYLWWQHGVQHSERRGFSQHEEDINQTEDMFDRYQEVALLERFLVVHNFEDIDGWPNKFTIYRHSAYGSDTKLKLVPRSPTRWFFIFLYICAAESLSGDSY